MGEPIEERMMAEWAASRLVPGTYAFHVRLGRPRPPPGSSLSPADAARFLRFTLPEADLVVRAPGSAIAEIVEFVVWRPQETLGQLMFYMTQLRDTHGYDDVLEVRGRIVTGVDEPRFREMVGLVELAYEVYRPPWLEEALAARRGGSRGR